MEVWFSQASQALEADADLEKFDGIGAFRAHENNAVIDTSGTFQGVSFNGAAGLGKAIASSKSVTECVTGRVLEYATGRADEGSAAQIEAIEKAFESDGYRLPALFFRIATLPDAYRVTSRPIGTPAKVATSSFPLTRKGANQ